MKILVIGNKGNMGRRYQAILNHLEVDNIGIDYGDKIPTDFDKAIIATPTVSHTMDCMEMIRRKKDFLCEKPLSKITESIDNIIAFADKNGVDGRMVCNWCFATDEFKILRTARNIYYDCYNTGGDGYEWDLIQLIYLYNGQGSIYFENKSPMLEVAIDMKKITRQDIDISYIRMIDNWLKKPDNLWSLEQAKEATIKVIKYKEIHDNGNGDTDTSEDEV